MLTELPKLFGREFAVGYFLPATVLLCGAIAVLYFHGVVSPPSAVGELNAISSSFIAILAAWLIAITLMALNYQVLRIMEGYPLLALRKKFGLQAHIDSHNEKIFQRKFSSALSIQSNVDATRLKGLPDPEVPADHSSTLRMFSENFPDRSKDFLPTRFGNVLRAAEVYSRVVCGLDSIPAWPRLQFIIPEQTRKVLGDAKAQLDFCVNVTLSFFVLSIVHAVWCLIAWNFPAFWLLPVSVVICYLSYLLSVDAAKGYGAYVKSCFDVHRKDLANALGVVIPHSPEHERLMWIAVSRMMIYRSRAGAGSLTQYKPHSK